MRDRRFEITPMQASDLDDVMEIERHAFGSQWARRIFLEELERDWARIDVVRSRDAAGNSRVIAFCNYWVVRDEIHLLNIATLPESRRCGQASLLLAHLLTVARRQQCRYITLEVRRSNTVAIALYEHVGFCAVGVRPKYYAENREDAIVMTLELQPTESG